jgi:hypothetical protein
VARVPQLLQSEGSSPIAATEDPTQFGSCNQPSPNKSITGSDSSRCERLLELAAVPFPWRLVRLPPDGDDDVDCRVDLFRVSAPGDGASDLTYLRITDEGIEFVEYSCWEEFC